MPLPGFWKEWKSGRKGGRLLGQVLPPLLLPLFPLLGAGLLLRCVKAAATVGSWPPRASHRASHSLHHGCGCPMVASSYCLSHGCWKTTNIAKKRSLSGEAPGGRFCLSFPMRTLGLSPAFPWEGEGIQNKTAICSYQTVQAKYFSKSRTAHVSRCRHQWYQECPEGLAWAGWQVHWHI